MNDFIEGFKSVWDISRLYGKRSRSFVGGFKSVWRDIFVGLCSSICEIFRTLIKPAFYGILLGYITLLFCIIVLIKIIEKIL